ncbi:MAG: adenylyl-sulfate kinase [Polyangiaceae bacterium]
MHATPVLWLTGLPGAGKTTLSVALRDELRRRGIVSVRLDGDELRDCVSSDLGFSRADRDENVRRTAGLAGLLASQGVVAIVALVSPYREARDAARASTARFVEVFVSCPLDVCEERDPKGMYAAARAGKLPRMTGVSDPYEPPLRPEVVVRTERQSINEGVALILRAAGFAQDASA